MLPALKAVSGGKDTSVRVVRERVAAAERLTEDDLREMLPSGQQSKFINRMSWVFNYLTRAGLLERVRRGVYRVTDKGRQVLAKPRKRIDVRFLRQIQENDGGIRVPISSPDQPQSTPEEALEAAHQQLTGELTADVLDRLRKATPSFLEQVVVSLLIAMGYGGGDPAMGRVVGRAGDGGIDGTIKEDKLGLDEVYVQAKRYASGNTVGAGELRNFVGALVGAHAQKGVFVTTSNFRAAAKKFAAQSPKRIVLVNGEKLAELMVRHDVGVRVRDPHRPPILIKGIDEDFFSQE